MTRQLLETAETVATRSASARVVWLATLSDEALQAVVDSESRSLSSLRTLAVWEQEERAGC